MPAWDSFDDIFAPPKPSVATTPIPDVSEAPTFEGDGDIESSTTAGRRRIAFRAVKFFLAARLKPHDMFDRANQGAWPTKGDHGFDKEMPDEIKRSLTLCLAHWPTRLKNEEDLLEWYLELVRQDYHSVVVPTLNSLWSGSIKSLDNFNDFPRWGQYPGMILDQTCGQLELAKKRYSLAIKHYMLPAIKDSKLDMTNITDPDRGLARVFRKRLTSMFIYSLPMENVYTALTLETQITSMHGFQLQAASFNTDEEAWSWRLLRRYVMLRKIGLGGAPAVRAVAKAIDCVIALFIRSRMMKVDWIHKKSVTDTLRFWIEEGLVSWVKHVAKELDPEHSMDVDEEAKQWLAVGIDELGKLRVKELFWFVCRWPQSQGAILDIKAYIVTAEARKYLTAKFQEDIQRRLLHAGATTRQILDIYMLIIQTFTALDSRGVLLDNVSRPIRKYLKGRQDTARIIISSMLADTSADRAVMSDHDISIAIADEMLKPINLTAESQRQDSDLNYDNMDYMPQPNDAGADFRTNGSSDAISHLFSLYDREQFVTVLQDILGEHLLKFTDDLHLEKETHLLELFKARFGEERMQACEVMLRDVTNSRRMNKKIRQIPEYARGAAATATETGGIELNAQILSSFFWPDLRDDEFEIPAPVKELQNLYEKGFESHHNLMRLRWLPSLGRASVKLVLGDRVVVDSVPTWVASLIYAFNDGGGGASVTKSVDELQTELAMDEALLISGLMYWVNKRVLKEVRPGQYAVIERLPTEKQQAGVADSLPVLSQEVSAVKSAQDRFNENAHMYKQFVYGMLTNGGHMSLSMMLSMLKVVIPTGFPFGEAELQGLLQGLVDEGKVVCQGDMYSVRRGGA